MMDCATFASHRDAFLDGRLTEEESRLVERHLAECPTCQAAIDHLLAADAPSESKPSLSGPSAFLNLCWIKPPPPWPDIFGLGKWPPRPVGSWPLALDSCCCVPPKIQRQRRKTWGTTNLHLG